MAEKKTAIEKETKKAKAPVKKAAVKAVAKRKVGDLAVEVFDMAGKSVEKLTLPKEVFGAKVNKALMAQAVRVHLVNSRQGTVSTKTRGEVQGSTRKIYRQKGTGRARHGGVRAPIFVHGGVAFGPKPRIFDLSFSKKMRKAALASALTSKLLDNGITVVTGLQGIKPKTKEMATVLKMLSLDGKKRSVLLVTDADNDAITRSVRNIEGIDFTKAVQLSTYDVLHHKVVLVMKEAIDTLKKHIVNQK